jgi:CHAT domain-containing protein/Tfp pilus assembly protein PilF
VLLNELVLSWNIAKIQIMYRNLLRCFVAFPTLKRREALRMLRTSFLLRRLAGSLLLFLSGTLVLPLSLTGQTVLAPPQTGGAAGAQLSAETQAQFDKLEGALKAARTAGDRRAEASILNQIGELYFRLSEYGKALDWYVQAQTLARSMKNAQEEAAALNGIGFCYQGQSQNKKALEANQQALSLATGSGDLRGQATALSGIGWIDINIGKKEDALDYQKKALPLARQAGDHDLEATILRGIGVVYSDLGEKEKALEQYSHALPIYQTVADRAGEAKTLNNIGSVYDDLGEKQKALDYYEHAASIFRAVGNRNGEANALKNIGNVHSDLGEKQKALEYDNQALTIFRAVGNRKGEANALNDIGNVFSDLGEMQKALEYDSQAVTIFRAEGDRDGEANALNDIGNVYSDLGENQKALDDFDQALPILRAMGDRANEAVTLNNIGLVYSNLGEQQKALDYYNQAVRIYRAEGDRGGEARTLANIGNTYSDLGEEQKALDDFNQALPILREVGDRPGEARTLTNIGDVYSDMGEKQRALEDFKQALPILRAVGDRAGEAGTLNNIGNMYSDLGEKQKALDYFNQALPILRAAGDKGGEADALNNIGNEYDSAGDRQKALDYYNQAVPIYRAVGDRRDEAKALNNIGLVYSDLGEKQKALNYYSQALSSATAVGDPLLDALTFHNMAENQMDIEPALAIFYGKLAINFLQRVRGNIRDLDKELQKSFLDSKKYFYDDLAGLLIREGRLPEAQQTLNLLKQQEYSDYVRGGPVDSLSPLTLTPAEQQAEQEYEKSTAKIVSLGEQWAQLKKTRSRTTELEKQFQELSDQLDAASKGLNDYYTRLYVLFGKNSEANKQVADVKGNVSLLRQQIAKMPNTVALYTMVTSDHYRVIVITGSTAVAREYAVSEEDLNKKVLSFQQVLHDPAKDPKRLAQELYTILIGPVKGDLEQAQAKTLVLSLDGVLRYVPMAALYDGKHYLVENYNTVTITPVSIPHLSENPDVSNLSAAAMGISQKYEAGLNPLPSVVSELEDIVKDPQVQGAHGVLPGTILLNGQFTEKAMENELSSQHEVVHIASHFVFKPGDDSQSYLLMAGKDDPGKGYHLTVADFRDNQKLTFDDTDLLTLSACETGMSGNAGDGREVDGLGTTAQLKGAKAVISSLWEVDDASTGLLMGDFYKRWAEGAGKVTKVEALRQAQLDLLLGKVMPASGGDGRGFGSRINPGVPAGYSHPFYWAPFVLMGNWR